MSKQPNQQLMAVFVSNISKSKLPERVQTLAKTLSSKTDISPRGFVACLIFISDMINMNILDNFVEESFIKSLVSILKEDQVESIIEWPNNFGGG